MTQFIGGSTGSRTMHHNTTKKRLVSKAKSGMGRGGERESRRDRVSTCRGRKSSLEHRRRTSLCSACFSLGQPRSALYDSWERALSPASISEVSTDVGKAPARPSAGEMRASARVSSLFQALFVLRRTRDGSTAAGARCPMIRLQLTGPPLWTTGC